MKRKTEAQINLGAKVGSGLALQMISGPGLNRFKRAGYS